MANSAALPAQPRRSAYRRFLEWRQLRLNIADVEAGGHDIDDAAATAIRNRIANGWPLGRHVLGVR